MLVPFSPFILISLTINIINMIKSEDVLQTAISLLVCTCSLPDTLYKLSIYHSNLQTSQLPDTNSGRNTTIIQEGLSNIVHSKQTNYLDTQTAIFCPLDDTIRSFSYNFIFFKSQNTNNFILPWSWSYFFSFHFLTYFSSHHLPLPGKSFWFPIKNYSTGIIH